MTEVENKPQATNELTNFPEEALKERQTGRVKWFNNRAGYGFITLTRGVGKGKDVFVHHSGIKVDKEQYKYLVQGEYVEFDSCKSSNDKHPYQACAIRGVDGGNLMCETRYENRRPRQQSQVNPHGRGPRDERAPDEHFAQREKPNKQSWSMVTKGGKYTKKTDE